MFDNDSEGEQVEEETDTDYKWRKERYEREQFIQEQQVSYSATVKQLKAAFKNNRWCVYLMIEKLCCGCCDSHELQQHRILWRNRKIIPHL